MEIFSTEGGRVRVFLNGEELAFFERLELSELLALAKEKGIKTFQVKAGDEYLTSGDFPLEPDTEMKIEIVPVYQAK